MCCDLSGVPLKEGSIRKRDYKQVGDGQMAGMECEDIDTGTEEPSAKTAGRLSSSERHTTDRDLYYL